jgi:DNA-directed RNA polymerase
MLRSFMPNFIHFLDASNVPFLIKYLSETDKIPFYTIHDFLLVHQIKLNY